MVKVWTFEEASQYDLQNAINDFISNIKGNSIKIINISYSTYVEHHVVWHCALLCYEENKNENS